MKDWPTILTAIATIAAPVLVKSGWLTTEQVGATGVLLGPAFVWLVHRMQHPGTVKP